MSTLPLFPLSGIVLPGGQLPLRIFEPRYLSMVSACMKSDSGFGICLIASGAEVGAVAKTFAYGTLVKIVDWSREDSGLLVIVTQGIQRFRIIDSTANSEGLLIGEVELLPHDKQVAIPSKFRELADLLQRALDQTGPLVEYTDSNFTDAAWVSNRLIELLPMSAAERNDLVGMSDPLERLSVLRAVIG